MKGKREPILLIIFIFTFFILQYENFKIANSISSIYSNWSLRFNTPFDNNTKESISHEAAEYSDQYVGLKFHYWTESKESVEGDMKLSEVVNDVNCIFYSGDLYTVFPVSLSSGRLPGEMETGYCVISTELSWQLWRSLDSAERKININDRELEVCGIFASKDMIVLCPGDDKTPWLNIEITFAKDEQLSRENITEMTAGLSTPDNIIDGASVGQLYHFFVYIPPVLLWIALILLYPFKKRYRLNTLSRLLSISAIAIFLAIVISILIYKIPHWLLPNKWSDFVFWQELLEKMQVYVKDFISVKPYSKDIMYKIYHGKFVIILFLQMSICTAVLIPLSQKQLLIQLKDSQTI